MNLSFLLGRLKRTERPVQKQHWIEKGTIVICCVLLTGCSLSIWNTKGKAETKRAIEPQKELLKPKIAVDSKRGPSVRIRAKSSEETDEDKSPKNSESKKERQEKSPSTEEETEAEKDEPADGSRVASKETDESFRKHDHSEYKRTIKNAAIDTLNKHRGSTAARLCRDTTTDLWTLTIYSQGRGKLSFVIYFWDEVDGKWERSFESGNVPPKKWRSHLRYASADKTCTILKGAHLLGK